MADTDDMNLIRVGVLGISVDQSTTWTSTGPAGNRNTLNTADRIINRAINTINAKTDAAELVTDGFADRFTHVIGQELGADQTAFDGLGKNLIQTVVDLKAGGGGTATFPTGGATGDVLAKASPTDNDVEWISLAGATQGIPVGGDPTELLAKKSATDFDVEWIAAPEAANGVPSGGLVGQFLAKSTNVDFDLIWLTANVDVVADPTFTNLLDSINGEIIDWAFLIDKLNGEVI